MMRILLFSRDRALQLEATLHSLRLQTADSVTAQVVVLFRATSPRYESQYAQVAMDYGDMAHFVVEADFRSQVADILHGIGVATPSPAAGPMSADDVNHWLFLVDDCLFIRPFQLGSAEDALDAHSDALGFSLRLGVNTTYCYSLGRPQRLPVSTKLESGILKFRWPGAQGDFGYPLEISSSLYRARMVMDFVSGLRFNSPSTLESQMALHAGDFSRRHPALLCFEHSVAFCAPVNRVQEVFDNRAGAVDKYSIQHLADLFDEGRRINVRSLTGFEPNACHQEVELNFERRDEHNQGRG